MGIRINENIFSLFVNRNLQRNDTRLDGTFRRLSSGEKITRSGDDPAGLANSHILRSKITGLQRNLINCDQGLNLLSVAESSLSNVTDNLQRLRELALQCANDTMTDEQRSLVQKEVDQVLDEIERIAVTANYNDKQLLDGTYTNVRLQVGTRINESIPLSIESVRINILGAVAQVTGANNVSPTAIAGTGDLVINNVPIPASEFDEVSTINGTASAIAKANAINSIQDKTNVTARVGATRHAVSDAAILGGGLDGENTALFINNVNIGPINFNEGDGTNVLVDRINGYTARTGVIASHGPDGELVLEAEDGRNVQLRTVGGVADDLGLAAEDGDIDTVLTAKITLTSPDTIHVSNGSDLLGLAAGQNTTFVDEGTALENLRVVTTEEAQEAITMVDAALEQVISRRANLGALENRLNKTISDLQLNVENLYAADSRIRDADFAVETANLTQQQIIQEAGIAILSQANAVPRMAMQLLQQ